MKATEQKLEISQGGRDLYTEEKKNRKTLKEETEEYPR